jgi:predicted RNase H-like nuclease (RuvC/YqgF family)
VHGTDIVVALVSIVGFFVVILGGIGSVAAYRVSKNTDTVKNYKETAQSWKERSESQEAEITELKAKMAERDQHIAQLEGQLHTLRDVVTGRTAVTELGEKLDLTLAELNKQIGLIAESVVSNNQIILGELRKALPSGKE